MILLKTEIRIIGDLFKNVLKIKEINFLKFTISTVYSLHTNQRNYTTHQVT